MIQGGCTVWMGNRREMIKMLMIQGPDTLSSVCRVLNYKGLGLGSWCLTALSTMFQLYRGGRGNRGPRR